MATERLVFDVVIIGGGVIGLTAAYELRRRLGSGSRIAVLDRQEPGREASWAGAGMIPPGDPTPATPFLKDLARYSAQRWPGLSAELHELVGIDNGYSRCGSLMLCGSPEEAQEEVTRWGLHAVEAQVIADCRDDHLLPEMSFEPLSAYLLPAAAQVRNPWHMSALKVAVGRIDSVFSETHVTGVIRNQNCLTAVRTPQGDIYANQFVLCAGAWTSTLLAQWGIPFPAAAIEPVRGQIILLRRKTARSWRVIERGKQYMVPRADGRVLVGSTEEFAGFSKTTTAEGIQGLLNFALETVPELKEASLEQTWAGLRPYSSRGIPYFGWCPELSNLLIAAGHFRAGLTLSPATGILSAELLLGQETSLPGRGLTELSP